MLKMFKSRMRRVAIGVGLMGAVLAGPLLVSCGPPVVVANCQAATSALRLVDNGQTLNATGNYICVGAFAPARITLAIDECMSYVQYAGRRICGNWRNRAYQETRLYTVKQAVGMLKEVNMWCNKGSSLGYHEFRIGGKAEPQLKPQPWTHSAGQIFNCR